MRLPGCFLLCLCAALALPSAAAADEGMCVEGSHLLSIDMPPGDLSERGQAGADALTWSAGTTVEAQLSRATQTEPSQPILWCSSPDDPRCRPAHGAPEGPQVSARDVGSCIAVGVVIEQTLTEKMAGPRPTTDGEARAGFRRAMDRPPRGHR